MKFETVDDALDYFETCQKTIMDAQNTLSKLLADYKAQTKEYFGIEDGTPTNIVQLVRLIERFGPKTYMAVEKISDGPVMAVEPETFCEHGSMP